MKRGFIGGVLLTLILAGSLLAGENWLDNLDTAKSQAAEEGKYVLVDFTGSDWCHWCKKLDGEVFEQKTWKEFAQENLVQVALDFPRKKAQTDEVKARNRQWMNEYGVRGFPTIFLLDPQGNKVAQTGYQKGGAKNYIQHVNQLINEHKSKVGAVQG